MSREFCRDVPDPWGCSESLCPKSSCAFFVSYFWGARKPQSLAEEHRCWQRTVGKQRVRALRSVALTGGRDFLQQALPTHRFIALMHSMQALEVLEGPPQTVQCKWIRIFFNADAPFATMHQQPNEEHALGELGPIFWPLLGDLREPRQLKP